MNNSLQKIIIVGGGAAGWMAANLFLKKWPECKITLVESRDIGTIGVGEGSTPYLKQFFKTLELKDSDWMPHCNATYKAGIRFPGWSVVTGYRSYFHPFYSELDLQVGDQFFVRCNEKRRGAQNSVHPDHYFVASQVAEQKRSPVPAQALPYDVDYGYHFDAVMLGRFLRKHAIERGLSHIIDNVVDVELGSQNEVCAVLTEKNGKIDADFFLDCTGFRGLLVNKTYELPFVNFNNNLFNDAAVTVATDISKTEPLPSETRSTALSYGWVWQIPLTNRYGNGYVYSSQYLDQSKAETELIQHLHLQNEKDLNVRHIKMRVGRLQSHWHKNCLAVGLSQGFVEPLEATALMLIQYTVESFIARFDPRKPILHNEQESYNSHINDFIEGIRDYIVAHYKLNSRTDTDYWRACREDITISDSLDAIIHAWDEGLDVDQELDRQRQLKKLAYLRPSWYVMLSGMGRFPKPALAASPEQKDQHSQRASDYCSRIARETFDDHWEHILRMAR
jgi:flavin-dependent dehydrogenase